MIKDIASSNAPLVKLVETALLQLGSTTSQSILKSYAQLLEDAIRADEGEDISQSSWRDLISRLDGDTKFEAAIHELAPAFGATQQQANQFIAMAYATVDVLDGADPDQVEAQLAEDIDLIEGDTDLTPFSHLEEDSRQEQLAILERQQTPDPARPEPSHIEEEE